MMQGLRNAGQTWLGKLVVTVLFGLLIMSFAIWGIADIFRGYGASTAVRVGSTEIGVEQLRIAYQNELQRLIRQTRGAITPDAARQLGLDRAVLSRVISDAALDERARQLGLGISDETIAQAILADQTFRGADGKFDRRLFDAAIRDAGYSEPRFIADQRRVYLRQHLSEGVAGGVVPPVALKEAANRIANETRSVDYVILPAARITPATPDDAALKTFFDERKNSFRAPEYRSLNILALTAEQIAKPDQVSDDDARKRYDEVKTVRFGSPERRAIRQIRFPTMEEAKAASDKIKAGATFASIAAERNLTDRDVDLGQLTKGEIVDRAVADAAFALAKDGVSGPIDGQFGPVLVTVTEIEPEKTRPFNEVKGELKLEIARARAQDQIRDLHDKIEDQRAGAKPLGEVAQSLGLTMRTVDAVSRQGEDRAGAAVALPERETLLRQAFGSDIGADNEPISTRDNGYVWFEVTKVDPARDRTLDEVRDQVVARFKEDDIARQLAEQAAALAKKVEGGETLAAVAAAEKLEAPKTATGLKRDTASGDLSRSAAVQIFNAPVGRVLSATATDGKDRLLIKITDAVVPPFVSTTQAAAQIDEQLRAQLTQDLLASYVARVQTDLGVTVNQEAVRLALGAPSP
ncbi:MAG: peptidylprolyl isomerase [Rhizobiales bacterium 65-9]|nr:SurA N-terminal domain-containing protein [Hyphomicrobiales bacterium]OJY35721.1 MAG: peptidylprolyl isomerase [Rhizobiales bacterium 65-9]